LDFSISATIHTIHCCLKILKETPKGSAIYGTYAIEEEEEKKKGWGST
jgi:hypothetical protein